VDLAVRVSVEAGSSDEAISAVAADTPTGPGIRLWDERVAGRREG
jgi:hypothetical protein